MAFTGMSPRHPDAVGALTQGRQEELRIHPPGTGNSNHPYVGWIFHPSDPCQVGRTVAAPVAQKSNDFRFPFGHGFILLYRTAGKPGSTKTAGGFNFRPSND